MSPVVIRVSLLSGRYHAHPWGQAQHAMGGPEWPPSPWRLLRTIAACWFEASEPPCSAEEREELLNALGCAGAPRIWIPKASFSELPYYQPVTKEVREVNSRVLHFDHFAVVADPDVYFVFDVSLAEKQCLFLSRILSIARYFGRAESRASFELVDPGSVKADAHHEVRPAGERQHRIETIRRTVLVTTKEFEASNLWQVHQASGSGEDHPRHLVEALIAARKRIPNGTTWVQYELPREALVHELPRRNPRPRSASMQPAAEVVFRLFRRVPIPVLNTVMLARDFRDQAVRAFEQATGRRCVLLSGRDDNGNVARGNRHAYYLPQPVRSGGLLERLVVRLPGGENGVEQEILDALLSVTQLLRGHTYPVLVVAEEVRAGPTAPSASSWHSVTPFLAPLRHRVQREWTDPAQQVRRAIKTCVDLTPELKSVDCNRIVSVLSHLYNATASHGRRHHRFTRRGAIACRLEFLDAVELPVAIGADAHFGLGQFTPTAGAVRGE